MRHSRKKSISTSRIRRWSRRGIWSGLGIPFFFTSRLPATYNECGRVIAEAEEKDEWEDIGVLAETKPTKNRPAAYYKSYENEVELLGKNTELSPCIRALTTSAGLRESNANWKRIVKSLASRLKRLSKEDFFFRPDAEKAMKAIVDSDGKYQGVEANIVEISKYKGGRPANGAMKIDGILFAVNGVRKYSPLIHDKIEFWGVECEASMLKRYANFSVI